MLLAAVPAAQAQTWATVDDIENPSAYARGIAADSAGNVFVAGQMNDSAGISHAVVMKSGDHGTTWFTSDDVAAASFRHIASSGSLTVATGLAGGTKWLIRSTVDGGATWATLDLFTHPNPKFSLTSLPSGVALDGSGNIYVAGTATETIVKGGSTSTVSRPLIRKCEAGAWRTIVTTFPAGMMTCAGTSVFAACASSNGSWQVRKSTDGGNSWILVNEYRFDASASSFPYGLAADSQGNLFVVGSGNRVTASGRGRTATTLTERFWIVRKGTASGTQWSTIDTFDLGRPPMDPDGDGNFFGAMSFANAVTVDASDNVLVTGAGVGPEENLQHWVTRRLAAGSATWTTIDEFNLIPGSSSSQAIGIAAGPAGYLFATGFSEVGGPESHEWLVRRSLTP